VTRRRSGTRSARVSWTRHSAERKSPRDVPTGRGLGALRSQRKGAQETTARTSYRQRLFVEHDLGESSGSAVAAARRAEYQWTEQMSRKMLRNVEKRGVQTAENGPSETVSISSALSWVSMG